MSLFRAPFFTWRDDWRSNKEVLARRWRRANHPVRSSHVWADILNSVDLLSDDSTESSSSCAGIWIGGPIVRNGDVFTSSMFVCGIWMGAPIDLMACPPPACFHVVPLWWEEARLFATARLRYQVHVWDLNLFQKLDLQFKRLKQKLYKSMPSDQRMPTAWMHRGLFLRMQ